MALLRDRSIRAWGGNKHRQLGDGTTVDRWTPVPVQTSERAVVIACRSSGTSCAVHEDGRALEWRSLIAGTRPGVSTHDGRILNWGVGYGIGGDSLTPVPLTLAGLDNG